MNSLQDVIRLTKQKPSLRVSVAVAEDREVLQAVEEAQRQGMAQFILFGNKERIEEFISFQSFPVTGTEIIHTEDPEEACMKAVKSVKEGEADVVMKGFVDTSLILRAVLNKEHGLRSQHMLSHVAVFDIPRFNRLLMVTDAAMNIAPNVDEKVQIIQNAVEVAHALGIKHPNVAPIAAVEKVRTNMSATIDAALLSKMAERGQITGATIEGPLGLDNAISSEAARHKGIESPVAGRADILLVPDIEAGNILYKSLVYFAGSQLGGLVVGAEAPVIITSRADTHETKLHSIGLALLVAYQKYREVERPLVHS